MDIKTTQDRGIRYIVNTMNLHRIACLNTPIRSCWYKFKLDIAIRTFLRTELFRGGQDRL